MFHLKPIIVLISPSVTEAENVARETISRGKTLLVAGNCWVHYQGRAKSKLEPGDRILLIKTDGSLLVHRSIGYEPVNWMPSMHDVIYNVQAKDEVLKIRAARQKPAETITVFFNEIHLAASITLNDSGAFSLYATEEDMQKAILLKPDMIEKDLKLIAYEKKVEPGFVDIYAEDKAGKLVVVEIKRKTARKEAVLQLSRYIETIRTRADRQVRGILVAPKIGKDVQRILVTLGLEYKHVDPKRCAETLSRLETKKLSEFFEGKRAVQE